MNRGLFGVAINVEETNRYYGTSTLSTKTIWAGTTLRAEVEFFFLIVQTLVEKNTFGFGVTGRKSSLKKETNVYSA